MIGPENRALALKAEDGAVDVRFAQEGTSVVDQITGGEIVCAVDDDVVGAKELQRIVRAEGDLVRLHLDVGIDFKDCPLGRLHLGVADGGLAVNDLALEVGFVHPVKIHNAQATHPRGGQVSEERRAQPAGTDGQHPGGLELALPLHRNLGHDQVPGITAHFRRAEVQGGRGFLDAGDQGH